MSSVIYKNNSVVSNKDYQSLKSKVDESGETSRICYHKSAHSPLHMMLICLPKNKKYPAHRHTDSDETITVLNGKLIITLFDSSGNSEKEIELEPITNNQESNMSILIEKGKWHSVQSGNLDTSFLEVKMGPFDKNKMELLNTSSVDNF